MVMCNMESVVIPRPPALPPPLNFSLVSPVPSKQQKTTNKNAKTISEHLPKLPPMTPHKPFQINKKNSHSSSVRSQRSLRSNNRSGFRLQDDNDNASVYSVFKQKIDAMFDSDTSSHTKNIVQARIEKMFSEVAQDGDNSKTIGVHSFTVDYLGSVPLHDKVTSLADLQSPLRDLYFAYKRITKVKKQLTGRLEISSQGLKVQYQGDKGDLEQLNSFPTIAVWSAVKFVIHDSLVNSYAFLPLITDPDNIDKKTLFRPLDDNEKKYITTEAHSPLFAVVMRKIGIHKQLECHGFLCQTSEDAIVIAATLYKSLMAHMKAKEKKPKNRNGLTCMSIASSVCNERLSNKNVPVRPPRRKRSTTSSTVSDLDNMNSSETQPLLQSSVKKSPKKSIKSKRAPKAPPPPPHDMDAILPYEEPINMNLETTNNNNNKTESEYKEIKPQTFTDKINIYMSREQKQITAEIKQVMSEGTNKGLKRVESVRKRNEENTIRKKENVGDILTKVTIPRSGSFLNAGGLTKYKSKVTRSNGQATGGSPLGFNELFNEFRLQEGLHSLDEILGVIIDPEGMSFNDLKPIYKEFLLKLSVTLTKDELYQRSKSIMRRHKKKMMKRSSSGAKTHHRILVSGKFKQLKHVFQKKFKAKSKKNYNQDKIQSDTVRSKLPESTISSTSYDTRQFIPKEEIQPVIKKQNYSRKKTNETKNRKDRTSTSEESDFLSIRRSKSNILNHQNRNSSSGYVSCSDCSYDSDSCTCVSADKCYCSLGNKYANNRPKKCHSKYCTKQEEKCCLGTLSFCECDTDSCTESNKCYCRQFGDHVAILNKLKQKNYLPNQFAINSQKDRKLCKKNSNTKSTRSLEYMHNPSETYYEKVQRKPNKYNTEYYNTNKISGRKYASSDNLALDYHLFTVSNEDLLAMSNNKYASRIAYSETGRLGAHKHGSTRSQNNSARYSNKKYGKTLQSTSIAGGASTEALSVKKSAEIAALFADIKLSQTTDIAHLARTYSLDPIFTRNNGYTKLKSVPTKHTKSQEVNPPLGFNSRMNQSSLYSSRHSGRSQNRHLYSARNGLYTIQSQSDESRRSSVEDKTCKKHQNKDYFDVDMKHNGLREDAHSLENSLGYLP